MAYRNKYDKRVGSVTVNGKSYKTYQDDEGNVYFNVNGQTVTTVCNGEARNIDDIIIDYKVALRTVVQSYSDYRKEMAALAGRY
jgi:hypothetical protein